MSATADRNHLIVGESGLFSTLQDGGRFGYQRFGISNSGAMDRMAMSLANALVGNPREAGVIEMTMSGMAFTVAAETCRIALAGAPMALAINGHAAPHLEAHDLARGDKVAIGRAASGMRAYLAVAGGFAVAPVLGSVSTHTRSRIGGLDGEPLRTGAVLPLAGTPTGPALRLDAKRLPRPARRLRVVLGPQSDAFTPTGIDTFLTATYRLSARADRMGCQLEGPEVEHAAGFNIVSDGIANGSIQIPGHGRPIILLADRQSTGGYPKIATVIGADLGTLAQLRPGDELAFEAVTPEQAAQAARAVARELDDLIAAMEPATLGPAMLASERLLALNLVGGVTSASSDPFSEAEPS
ncbi:5-oxoprolinase subunit C family protein [Ancylobacter terrae]|uniref:5-oxoprolinase subunit C family protein n=1 Tax=Ancylobacter sp. sgz301288 TaxID=3342077 RepID=UPI00385D0090